VRDLQDGTPPFGHVLLYCDRHLFVVKTSLDVLCGIKINDRADTFIEQPRELIVKGFDETGPNVCLGPRNELYPYFVSQRAIIPGPGAERVRIDDTWQGVTASLVQPPPFLLCRRARRRARARALALARSLTNVAPLCAVWYPQDILAGYDCVMVEPGLTVFEPVPVDGGPSLPDGVDTGRIPVFLGIPAEHSPSPEKRGRDDEADAGGRAKRARGA
jgi:hypothetical protein